MKCTKLMIAVIGLTFLSIPSNLLHAQYVNNNPTNYVDPYGLFSRNTDNWRSQGLGWNYFSEENAAVRQKLRELQQYYNAKYQAAEREAKLRGNDEKWKEYCCCAAKDACKGVIVGIGQGGANTVNGLQDAVIGTVNLSYEVCKNLPGPGIYQIPNPSLMNLSGNDNAFPYNNINLDFNGFPSPDWSNGLLMNESPFQHEISKFMGGQGAFFLITVGTSNALQGAKACKAPPSVQCADDAAKVHGNGLQSPKPNSGYKLVDKDTGKVLKYGETTATPPQGRYPKNFYNDNNAEMIIEKSGTKPDIHNWQHDKIVEYKNANNGNRPPLNKSDW